MLSPERLSDLRRAVEAPKSGPGYHHVSNDELAELLASHEHVDLHVAAFAAQKRERDQIKAERDAAQEELADLRLCDQRARALLAGGLGKGTDATRPMDSLAAEAVGVLARMRSSAADATALAAGTERELLEVRAELARVLGGQVSSYMTPVGLARAVASRVEELRERMRRALDQARTGKFAGPPQDASPADNATWIFAMDTALADAAKKARTAWTIARGNCASSAPSETRRALQAARAAYNVSTRSLHAALTLMELGIAELLDAVEAGAIKLYAAAEIAQLAPAKQYETLDKVLASAEVRA